MALLSYSIVISLPAKVGKINSLPINIPLKILFEEPPEAVEVGLGEGLGEGVEVGEGEGVEVGVGDGVEVGIGVGISIGGSLVGLPSGPGN